MKTKIIVAVAVLVYIIAFFVVTTLAIKSQINQTRETFSQQYQDKVALMTSKNTNKVDLLKEDVLNRLKKCESGALTVKDAPLLLDTNHKISMGMFMFQRDTVIYYYSKLYHQTIDRHQAVIIALSPKARSLASDIIFNVRGGIFNWANCAKQENLVTEVTIIKRIQ